MTRAILAEARRSKYGNRRTVVDGVSFHSAKEARRYQDLKLLERAGEIRFLRLQVPFPLDVNGIPVTRYVADFVYVRTKDDVQVIEDVKGFLTPEYKIKRALMKAVHGVEVRET